MKPFPHASGRWAVQFSAKNSGTGKRVMRYYSSERDALADIRRWQQQVADFGRAAVTPEERQWILFARHQLGNLDILPDVIHHWKLTGAGSITPTLVADAVRKFQDFRLPRLKSRRTQSDIRSRLNQFAKGFDGQYLHQLNAGNIETWLYAQSTKPWTVRSFFKRLRPMFAYAMRQRWIAENPLELLQPPEVPGEIKTVYTVDQINALLRHSWYAPPYLAPFLFLTAFAWLRTSELVRLYLSEDALKWEDINWNNKQIHIRETVGKATRRRSGNDRVVPMTDHIMSWLRELPGDKTGFIVPVLHREFAVAMRALHAEANVPMLHNGLRRSAISYYLAIHPETNVGQLAKWAGTSEATVRRHYFQALTPEVGRGWFSLKPPGIRYWDFNEVFDIVGSDLQPSQN
jgi:integrase